MISLEQIARALGGEISGGQVRAPGPGHSPKDRSLNIKMDAAAPGGFVVHSFAGDDPILCKDFVRERLGFDPFKAANGKRRIIATYDYTDEQGELLFQVCRFDPKDFRQRRPDGSGWDWKLADTRRVLYRLPDVLEAASLGKPIFVVEGEKAANALTELGVVATCSPGGAGKWRTEYSQYLAGAGDVIVLPDSDEPGEKHAADILKAIPSAKVLRLPGLPDKGDPFDWVVAGGTVDELWRLVDDTVGVSSDDEPKATDWRSHVVTAGALQGMIFPDPSYVVEGIIPEGLSILAGRPKIGKSWMALDIGLGIAAGEPVLGDINVDQGDVLYCCLEDNYRRLKRRITKLLGAFGGFWPDHLTLATRWRRLDRGGVDDLEAWCNSVKRPRAIILDTLAGVRPMRSGTDTLYEGDYAALRDVHRLANDRAMGVLALHHTRKMEADDPVDTISGSLGLAGAADTCLILARASSGTTLYVRGRDIEESEKAVIFGTENCKWSLLGNATEVHRTESQKKILTALLGATGLLNPGEIASLTEIPRGTVDTTLHRMAAKGEVVQVSRGRYAHPSKDFAASKREKS